MTNFDVAHKRQPVFILLLLGALTGMLSGLFGIGGGIVLVPLLVLVLGYQQKLAAGTSVATILPAAIVGGITYAVQGHVDWIAALLLAIGIIGGAQLGSYLLQRIPTGVLRWIFMGFLVLVVVSLWFIVPSRDSEVTITLISGAALIVVGFVTGILSGLLGVGGGVIVVPVLMFFFGANDLVAKGTSLIMLIPGSISGTIGNFRRKNVDLRAAVPLGIAASVCSPLGSIVATYITPMWSNIAFSALLVIVIVQMATKALKGRKQK